MKPLQRLLHYEYLFESKENQITHTHKFHFSSLELLLHYKNLQREVEYQDCYGVYIKIQDLIDSFTDAMPNLVRIRHDFRLIFHCFIDSLLVESSKINRTST